MASSADSASLSVSLPAEVSSARFVPSPLEAAASPASVSVGVDCGMPDMCGLDPCLCGAADSWGACACNGMEDVEAQVSYTTSDASVATVEMAFGRAWVVPHGPGDAAITAVAELPHHEAATAQTVVHVEGFAAADGIAAAGIVVVLALVAGGIAAIARRRSRKGVRDGRDVA